MDYLATVNGADLLDRVARVIPDIDHRSTMKILTSLHIRIRDGGIVLTASRISSQSKFALLAETTGDAELCVEDPRKLLKWLRATKPYDVPVQILQDDEIGRVHFIRHGRSLRLLSLNADEYPIIRDRANKDGIKWRKLGTLAVDVLRIYGPSLLTSMSDDETRTYLNGIGIDNNHFTTTDGHRMLRLNLKHIGGNLDKTFKGIIDGYASKRLVQECRRKAATGNLEIYVGKDPNLGSEYDGWMEVEFEDHKRMIRLDGEPPTYTAIIPRSAHLTWKPDGAAFEATVNEIGAIASDRHQAAMFKPNGQGFHLTYGSSETGASLEAYVAGEVDRIEETIPEAYGFNALYMRDIMQAFGHPVVSLGNQLDAAVISEPGNPMIGIVMPIRL